MSQLDQGEHVDTLSTHTVDVYFPIKSLGFLYWRWFVRTEL